MVVVVYIFHNFNQYIFKKFNKKYQRRSRTTGTGVSQKDLQMKEKAKEEKALNDNFVTDCDG